MGIMRTSFPTIMFCKNYENIFYSFLVRLADMAKAPYETIFLLSFKSELQPLSYWFPSTIIMSSCSSASAIQLMNRL